MVITLKNYFKTEKLIVQIIIYSIIILSTLFVYAKLFTFGLKGSDFGYFHLLDEKYAGIFGGPIDDIPSYKNLTSPYLGHAVLGRTLEFAVETTAGDRIRAYRFLELIIISLINILFYKVLRFVTKKTWLSLLAALFLLVNAPGFELYEQYTYFIERIPVIPFVLVAFIFWVKSFNESSLKSYFLTIFFYSIAILLGHYAILFVPLFIFYGVFKGINHSSLFKSTKILIYKLTPIFLILITVVLYSTTTQSILEIQERRVSSTNPLTFLSNEEKITEKVMIQLASVLTPSQAIGMYAKYKGKYFSESFREFMPYVIIIYIAISLFILKNCRPSLKTIYLTAQFSLLSSTLINLYLDRVNFESELGASRLYYVPYLFLSIVMAITIYTLFLKTKSSFLRGEIILVVAVILYMNNFSIQKGLGNYDAAYAGVLKTIDWAREESQLLPPGAIVYLPQQLGDSSAFFFQRHYGENTTFYGYDQLSKTLPELSDNSKIVLLDFNENYRLEEVKGLEIVSRTVSKSDLKKELRQLKK